ncbi:hypothetical protein EVAR_27426_1 [Eumeta japonica]|uniref:Uncharacterized protein n=1 Tax=Eumeta variegata TaxID=151549 RepID=A0A4C1VIY6_EUMVA|nr:hypothetical protein EVAR_27426_1 [Eumeta japonica]
MATRRSPKLDIWRAIVTSDSGVTRVRHEEPVVAPNSIKSGIKVGKYSRKGSEGYSFADSLSKRRNKLENRSTDTERRFILEDHARTLVCDQDSRFDSKKSVPNTETLLSTIILLQIDECVLFHVTERASWGLFSNDVVATADDLTRPSRDGRRKEREIKLICSFVATFVFQFAHKNTPGPLLYLCPAEIGAITNLGWGYAVSAFSGARFSRSNIYLIVQQINPVLNFGPGSASDSESSPFLDSAPCPAFNFNSTTTPSSDLNEARGGSGDMEEEAKHSNSNSLDETQQQNLLLNVWILRQISMGIMAKGCTNTGWLYAPVTPNPD